MKWMITKFIAIIILWCKSNHYSVYRAECWLSLNKISEKGSTSQSYNRVVEWAPNNGYHQQFHPQRESQLLPDSPWGSPRSASVCDLVVQLPSCVWLFVTPWTVAHQDFHDLPYLSVCSNSCHCLSQWCYHPSHPLLSFSPPSSFQTTASVLELWVC